MQKGSHHHELSEFSQHTGVVFEGFLEKKSRSGLWIQRYYILNESSRDCFVLRSYCKAIETAWGKIPIQLKSEIPICNITGVDIISTSKNVHEFTISVGSKVINDNQCSRSISNSIQSKSKLPVLSDSLNLSHTSQSNHHSNDIGSVVSDVSGRCSEINNDFIDAPIKIIKLRALDAEVIPFSY